MSFFFYLIVHILVSCNYLPRFVVFQFVFFLYFKVLSFFPQFESVIAIHLEGINCSDQGWSLYLSQQVPLKSVCIPLYTTLGGFSVVLRQTEVLGSNGEDVKTGSGLKTGLQESLKSHRLLLVITRVKMTLDMYKLTLSGREEDGYW